MHQGHSCICWCHSSSYNFVECLSLSFSKCNCHAIFQSKPSVPELLKNAARGGGVATQVCDEWQALQLFYVAYYWRNSAWGGERVMSNVLNMINFLVNEILWRGKTNAVDWRKWSININVVQLGNADYYKVRKFISNLVKIFENIFRWI